MIPSTHESALPSQFIVHGPAVPIGHEQSPAASHTTSVGNTSDPGLGGVADVLGRRVVTICVVLGASGDEATQSQVIGSFTKGSRQIGKN
jgi:hypothetical protein